MSEAIASRLQWFATANRVLLTAVRVLAKPGPGRGRPSDSNREAIAPDVFNCVYTIAQYLLHYLIPQRAPSFSKIPVS